MTSDMIEVFDGIFVHAKEVGDMTYYFIALVDYTPDETVYVALGGRYAPTIGGFFPRHMLSEFGRRFTGWAQGEYGANFFEAVTFPGFFHYMLSKQVSDKPSKWDMIVAFIFAWLFSIDPDLVKDHEILQIIGAANHDDQEKTMRIMEEFLPTVASIV